MHPNDIRGLIDKALARIRRPFRGVINRVDNTPDNQLMQVSGLDTEDLPGVEFMQQYGFSSSPPAGTQCIILPLGGKTGHGVIVATENGGLRFKPLKAGEAVIYNSAGDFIALHGDRITEINCQTLLINASEKVDIQTPLVNISKDLKVGRNAAIVQNMETDTFNALSTDPNASSMAGGIRAVLPIISDSDVIAAGVSGRGHKHGGVQNGGGATSTPL